MQNIKKRLAEIRERDFDREDAYLDIAEELAAENAELLDALKGLEVLFSENTAVGDQYPPVKKARAAIAKATSWN